MNQVPNLLRVRSVPARWLLPCGARGSLPPTRGRAARARAIGAVKPHLASLVMPLHLCTDIPTPYLALSLLYSSLGLCNTRSLY